MGPGARAASNPHGAGEAAPGEPTMKSMPTHMTLEEETAFVRDYTAERLERLAAMIRHSSASVDQLDAAYSAIVNVPGEVRTLLEP